MDWDRNRRFDDHRGGESYRPGSSRAYSRRSRSPPRIRSPRLVADTWVPSAGRAYGRARSRSPPPFRRRSSRSPSFYNREGGLGPYSKSYSRRFSPRRDGRPRSPAQSLRRARSPYGDDRTRDVFWSQSAPKRPRENSQSDRDAGFSRKDRHPPPSADQYTRPNSPLRHRLSAEEDQRLPTTPRARSPFYGGRREPYASERFSAPRRRSPSPKGLSSKRTSAPGSISNSRRSSPIPDKFSLPPVSGHSRSPAAKHSPSRVFSQDSAPPSGQDERATSMKHRPDQPKARSGSPGTEQAATRNLQDLEVPALSQALEIQRRPPGPLNPPHTSSIPSQPKAFLTHNQSLFPGPPHGPKTISPQNRSSNISLLSAPTRPRGGSSFKETGWTGSSIRRGPIPIGAHGTPTGPRSNHVPSGPGGEIHRHHSYRQNSVTGASYSHPQRHPNHLVGLRSIIPGGKVIPSELDTTMEKRLSQLDMDKDRLFEQIGEMQKLKRSGLRDWDRLDRESSICALKSELAEGHLHCITDADGNLARSTF